MSGKMKFALLILAFLAPLSVAFFLSALTLPSSAPLSANVIAQLPTISAYDDADGDGLSNRDENLWRTDWKNPDTDGDGFLDGEEVISGHDPRRPGPNDFLDKSKNLTERFGSLFVGGAISGDILPGLTSSIGVVGDISDEVFDEYERFAMVSQENVDINVIEDTPENLTQYLADIAPHLQETFPDAFRYAEDFIGDFGGSDLQGSSDFADDEDLLLAMRTRAELIELEMNEFSRALIDIPVPESMARPHLNGIVILQSIADDVQSATLIETDPLRATLSNTSLISLLTRTGTAFAYDFVSTLNFAMERTIIPVETPNE